MTSDFILAERFRNVSLVNTTLEKLSESQRAVVDQLQVLQKSRDKFEIAYNKELNELRAKYDALYRPVYEERLAILSAPVSGEYGTPSLPQFWLTAMKNNSTLRAVIEAQDEPILAYLTNIECEYLVPAKQESYRITLTFDENPFFSNKTLSKQYNMKLVDGEIEALLQGTEATTIDWYPDKDVTRHTVTKIQRNKRTKETRTKTQVEPQASFFRFFTGQEVPSNEVLAGMTKQEIADLEMYVEEDFDIGVVLRDKIIPEAIYWYLGIAEDEEEDEYDDVYSYENSESNVSDSD